MDLFLSDRDNWMNLYSIDLASKELKQLTTFKDFDINFPRRQGLDCL
jgi:tricorn protease-like protein